MASRPGIDAPTRPAKAAAADRLLPIRTGYRADRAPTDPALRRRCVFDLEPHCFRMGCVSAEHSGISCLSKRQGCRTMTDATLPYGSDPAWEAGIARLRALGSPLDSFSNIGNLGMAGIRALATVPYAMASALSGGQDASGALAN